MKHTPENILALAQQTADSLTKGAWPAFLRTAAWNFKYDFTSQLLIFAQKPDATACAPYDLWTSAPFHRRPMKGRAIALLADDAPNSDLRYVFDISDTVIKKGAPDPADPVWEVTPQKELTVRKALAEAFLPYEQQTDLHLASDASDFYRSIAFSIVRTHYEDFFKDSMEIETERTIRNLLTESVSAMLQFRCGLIPAANEDILAQITVFHGPDTISAIGNATQAMAKIGLQEVSHAVHVWDTKHTGQNKGVSREEELPESGVGICEDDIVRALTVGPPLEHGKFRLQRAAEDPKLTSEQLAATLRREYGTGQRAFMLSSGIRGTLFWGPEGLKIERNGLRECVHLTLDWKTASERLKRLIAADLYLDRAEKRHMLAWEASQKALLGRQKTGAALSAILTTLVPSHPELHLHQEQIRAYVYENSSTARRSLADILLKLNTQESISSNQDAQALLNTLINALSASETIPSNSGIAVQTEGEGRPPPAIWEEANRSNLVQTTPNPEMSVPSEPASEQIEPNSERPKEPLTDHPELRQKELHRLERSDKVALTDLLYHYITYRYTFNAHTPELCSHDAARREEQLAILDTILVSPSVEENLENIRVAKTILTRWFLPFDGIRSEILAEQDKVIDAAEQVLSAPPEQGEDPTPEYAHDYAQDYAHNYNYTHNESIGAEGLGENTSETLWCFEYGAEEGEPVPLSDKIQGARSRAASASLVSSGPGFSAAKQDLMEIGN